MNTEEPNINVNSAKTFLQKWKDYLGEDTYARTIFNYRANKTKDKYGVSHCDWDVMDDILSCVKPKDTSMCISLILSQTKKTIDKLNNSMYNEEYEFNDDFDNISFEDLEKKIVELGGNKLNVSYVAFTNYKNELFYTQTHLMQKLNVLRQEQEQIIDESEFIKQNSTTFYSTIKKQLLSDQDFIKKLLIKRKKKNSERQ